MEISGLRLKNPVIAASGTFGFGEEYAPFGALEAAGAVVLKSVTLRPREGNPPPRLAEVTAGLLNSIGLQNPGVDALVEEILPRLPRTSAVIVANAAGETVSEYAEVSRKLDRCPQVAAIELNVSCPNVERGGIEFGRHPQLLREVVEAVRGEVRKPLWVKLPPLVTDIVELAEAAVEAGADALTVANTFPALSLDLETFMPRLGANFGGLSGPAIKPVVLRLVYEVARAVDVPIIGTGGVMRGEDVVEYLLVGATGVGVGTANMVDPRAIPRIVSELENFLVQRGISSVREIIGGVRMR